MTQVADFTLTSGDVAKQLNVTKTTVLRWTREGRLRCVTTPGRYRKYRQTDVDTLAASMLAQDGSAA